MVVWEESVGDWGPGLLDALNGIEDPRKPKGVRHPLPAVLAMSVCAMLGGARSLYAIAQWGREHPQFAQSLGFSREQTPCVATLHHVFRRLDVDAFESALGRWAQECLGEGESTIAIDGKALRGIHVFNVNYFCRLASIILAGSPPYPAPASGPLRSGSWGHRIPG